LAFIIATLEVFIVGRQLFAHLYTTNPVRCGLGMILSFFSHIALVIGRVIGLVLTMFA